MGLLYYLFYLLLDSSSHARTVICAQRPVHFGRAPSPPSVLKLPPQQR